MTSQAQIPATTTEIVDVVIVGGGFGGLCMAIKLKEAGIDNFVILEKENEVGGTWRDNSYPGCACDVQSHMYSYSFEGKADWSQRYAGWEEIQGYILQCTQKYGLRRYTRFGQEVIAANFNEQAGHWVIRTGSGDTLMARHWVLASGPLHVPQYPKIKGLESFKGKVFHSARWEHDYDLTGKNVVSIGTGGSAIQYIPEIAASVKQLYVFQRSPAWVIPRDERRYSTFSKKMFARFPTLRKLHRARLYWTNESRVWPIFNPSIARSLQKLAEFFIRYQVKDKETARKLTPDYTLGCKRILISNKYFPTFNRANVELVTDGIAEVRENSIITSDGVERPADCIILGTGFIVDPRVYMKEFELTGLNGRSLNEDWKDGAEAYYGTTVSGYPNMYHLVGPNTALGHNSIIFMIECQVNYILSCMDLLKQKGADYFDVKADVQAVFNEKIQKKLQGTVWSSGCQSWYQQADGKNFTIWPASTWRYWLETRTADPAAYEFVRCELPEGQAIKDTANV
ncbi:MAG: 4-hydroxyacetophenone monooxygenase [Gammaproteobacteria bacterium HGW-Gammaproteobacteria-14]|nr:MAG: 4-hydroxyacetophenone monooxygenase [Gammaproteobacteria bacterium HGW-Gammaproteobacteria-14]